MEENKKMENGIITEEALEQIAGGLNVKKAALIGALAAASVAIVGGGGFLIKKIHDKKKKPSLDLSDAMNLLGDNQEYPIPQA